MLVLKFGYPGDRRTYEIGAIFGLGFLWTRKINIAKIEHCAVWYISPINLKCITLWKLVRCVWINGATSFFSNDKRCSVCVCVLFGGGGEKLWKLAIFESLWAKVYVDIDRLTRGKRLLNSDIGNFLIECLLVVWWFVFKVVNYKVVIVLSEISWAKCWERHKFKRCREYDCSQPLSGPEAALH